MQNAMTRDLLVGCIAVWCTLVRQLLGVSVQRLFRCPSARSPPWSGYLRSVVPLKPYENLPLQIADVAYETAGGWSLDFLKCFDSALLSLLVSLRRVVNEIS